MTQPLEGPRRAALARDGAARRLRHATQVSLAAMVALGGAFVALAAGSTHPKSATAHTTSPSAPAKVAEAPAPPLVASKRTAPPPTQAPPVTPAPPPTPTYQPPVVSSGGS